jgi:hypothetical protein
VKIKSLFIAVLLLAGVLVAPTAQAADIPLIESFSFTPTSIEVLSTDNKVEFTLRVSHENGIENTKVNVTLKDNTYNTLTAVLSRTDVPTNFSLKTVTFKGDLLVPRNIQPGVFNITLASIISNSRTGYQLQTGDVQISNKLRDLVGAESGLLIRSNGNLNYNYSTFNGPTFDTTKERSFNDSVKYGAGAVPIWKVSEELIPLNYYELNVPSLSLETTTSTPAVCSTDGKKIKFIAIGNCAFSVMTAKTSDYLEKKHSYSVEISAARPKITLTIENIADQNLTVFPKNIELPKVYGANINWVLPTTATPEVCFTGSYTVTLVKSGICTLNYIAEGTSTLATSDLYTQTFKVLKNGVLDTPKSDPTPTATPTPTAKPVVKKTITCVKGTKTIKKTAVSPKCPKGYKLKK